MRCLLNITALFAVNSATYERCTAALSICKQATSKLSEKNHNALQFSKEKWGFFCYSQPQYCTNVPSTFYQNCIKNASSLDHRVQGTEFHISNFWEITVEVSTSCFFNQLHSREFKSGFTEKRVLSIRPLHFHAIFFLKYKTTIHTEYVIIKRLLPLRKTKCW